MPKWLVLALLLGLILFPTSASAQSEPKMEEINIELWSEYDQPSVLVIYEFVVSQETLLPTEITLRFPNEGNLVAVAVEENGELFNKGFTNPVKQQDWQTIKIQVDSYDPHRIEYYQEFTLDGSKRQFKYQWFGDYYAKLFTVNILVPADSTNLVTSPALETTGTALNGSVMTGTLTRQDLRMMNSVQFELEYQRASTALVKPTAPKVEPVATVGENTPGRVSIANLPWIIGGFGLALIAIALFSYWRSTQAQSNESQPRKRRRHKPEGEEEGQAYCHECGARAHAGDRFCRTCGSRLRIE
jgi:hypothetical protein